MSLPRVTNSDFAEEAGILHVATATYRARCVWRPLERRDVGVDGHIEYVTPDGLATGRTVAVQIKSGSSYFEGATASEAKFYPEAKHRAYWAEYPLPVILVLHNPDDGESIWVDVRDELRVASRPAAVRVPRSNHFDEAGVTAALTSEGPLPSSQADVGAMLRDFAEPDADAQGLCYLYLFAHGLTDLGAAVYIGADLLHEVVDVHGRKPRIIVGEAEHLFLDRYVEGLVASGLARVDFGQWRTSASERGLIATLIAPLTSRGRALRDLIASIERSLASDLFVGIAGHPGVTESKQLRLEQLQADLLSR